MNSVFEKNSKFKQEQEAASQDRYWSYYQKKSGQIVIEPVYYDLKQWLHKQGYWRYVYAQDKWILIQKVNNIIKEVYSKDVKKHILDYILQYDYTGQIINGNMVYEEFVGREGKVFSEGVFEIMDELDVNWNRDTERTAYYYFENKCVKIQKTGIKFIDYSELKGCVWDSQIIKRKIEQVTEYEDGNDFCQFLFNISGKDRSRYDSFGTTIGYMLHGFKNSTFLPAPILSDEIISDDPNGGSGKGIIIKALSHLRNVVDIDGKTFDFRSTFRFQRVNLNTQIIAFQDVPKNFDFEKLFSIITEGIEVQKKNRDEFKMPFSESPKIIVTTNYMIKGGGSSHERRKIELDLANYYHKDFNPEDDFGRKLFESWNDDEWIKFYNFMFECVKAYLSGGVVRIKSENLNYKKIVSITCKEFIEWASESIVDNEEYNKKNLYNDFIESYQDFRSLKQNTFSKWLEKYGEYKNYKVVLRKSGSDRYICYGNVAAEQTKMWE